jgi:hypothetical protein
MRSTVRGWMGLGMLALATGVAMPAAAQGLDPTTRAALDREAWNAQTIDDHLAIARAFAAAGYVQQAKQITDRAASRARTAGDWAALASAYGGLGYPENGAWALRRARDLLR